MGGTTRKSELQRQSLAKQVADDLIHKIVRRRVSSGEPLPGEQSLAAEYDVSRPVIREAMHAIEGQGYVEIVRGRGSIVAEPRPRTLENFFTWMLHGDPTGWKDLMVVRRVLEIESARSAAANRDNSDIDVMSDILSSMETVRDDPEAYNQLDIQFHIAISQAGGNDFLRYLIESVRVSLMEILSHLRIHLPPKSYSAVQISHNEILSAIRDRHEDRAAEAMDVHFADVIERLERVQTPTK